MVSSLLTQSVPAIHGKVKVSTQGVGVTTLPVLRASNTSSETVEIAYQVIGKNAADAEATSVLSNFEFSGDFGSLIYNGPDLRNELRVGLKGGSVRSSIPVTARSVDIKFDMGIIEFSQKLEAASVSLNTKGGQLNGIYSGFNSLVIATEAGLVSVDVLCHKESDVEVSSQFGAVAVNAVGFRGDFEAKTQLGQLNVSNQKAGLDWRKK
ncbi:hypothetical protein BCR33DRAFT_765321 [Rhizoclosmatium globosum]|uniref:Adhesin domain-containing protein n=1 Tax=Rhizoclosmatium globosum TaxID=329046 RepID=A0A1Y2CGJ8_9FUNG|nr:hypothetical protein BCR33DRAFT_765321 [Rhizoclosmatium globosum]|eukprot:ORY46149.1 hypothetical protein BCR33DRAFT_765321 [Rhizoclosmatium globosum]